MDSVRDAYVDLCAGMGPEEFSKWAGFSSEGMSDDEVRQFSAMRCVCAADMRSLFALSLARLSCDGTARAVCSVSLDFVKSEIPVKKMLPVLSDLKSAPGTEIEYVLSINSDSPAVMNESSVADAFSLLGSGLFRGVFFSGSAFLENPSVFARFIRSAFRHGQMTGIDMTHNARLSRAANCLIRDVRPREVVASSLSDADFLISNVDFLSENDITAVFTPDLFRRYGSELLNRIRYLHSCNVNVAFGSGRFLFHGISARLFCEEAAVRR